MRGKPGTVKRPKPSVRSGNSRTTGPQHTACNPARARCLRSAHFIVGFWAGAVRPIFSFVRRSARLRMLKAGSTRSCVRLGATRRT
jgi:hypothetical protein